MNILSLILVGILSLGNWGTEMNAAKTQAKTEKKKILLNFSGSDWCGPCIKLKKDFFENEAFKTYSDKNLILVRADFPRKKKNALSKELTASNEKLAELYNQEGKFPLTVLLDENGKVIKTWDGYPKGSTVDAFIQSIHAATKGKI
jgi:thioredoxin-related protein